MIRVGIAGGAGYTAGELIRLLINHPSAELRYVASKSHNGANVGSVHTDLAYLPLCFSPVDFDDIDVLFLCMGHGVSAEYLASNAIPESVKIIDLGNDFRLAADAGDFVYGLPELNRQRILSARHIANPGCFATSIELALLPLAKAGLLPEVVDVFGITGSTGAGQKCTDETHFSYRSGNLSNYKVFTHQHLGEIGESLRASGAPAELDLAFVPVRGCHTRGIISNAVVRTDVGLDELYAIYEDFYRAEPFVFVSRDEVSLKQVVGTNYCFLSLQKEGRRLLVTSVIDNLLKGASGQAVENMNLMCSLDEREGLHLRAIAF